MHSLPDFTTVEIKHIGTKALFNLHPFLSPEPSAALLSSIASIGLLHPPIVQSDKNDARKYQILCGQKRLLAFCSCFPEKTDIPVLRLSDDLSHEKLLQYLLNDKLLSNTFSPMEKAYFFVHCLNVMPIQKAAETFLPILNERVQTHAIKRSISLLKLEQEIQESIHTGQVNQKLGLELLELTKDDRGTLHNLFKQLEFGGGKQKRLLTLCKDLAFRQEKSIASLMENTDCKEILEHREMNRPQKGALLLGYLHKQLFPASIKAQDEFDSRVRKIGLPSNCSIEHSPAFERDEISLTIEFSDFENIEKQMVAIKDLIKKRD